MSDAIKDTAAYRVLGETGERRPVNGLWRNVGDVIDLSAEEAEFYLREGSIEPGKASASTGKAIARTTTAADA